MSEERLPVHIQIDSTLKKLSQEGVFYYVPQRGDPHTGTILLKISDTKGECKLLTQMRDLDGKLSWFPMLESEIVAEKDADMHIAQSKDIDPDLWIIEIEDKDMNNPFDLLDGKH